ncbi:MAG TPA: replication factor C small subunit [Candidatus Nanoarchaeia archaeon]|nr:replication factor C small subunit [Candidatus Nanoarchaeia archaeon]
MNNEIWVEKYRPKTFGEIKGQRHIIERIKSFVQKKNMPHLLFSGSPGTGKSTVAFVIANELFGSNKENFLDLNSSDARGIDVIRMQVKDFARTKSIKDVPFKIIHLDESDALTKEAQQALRRTMENYSKTCRFILSVNYPSKIIDPIKSRCALFRFKPLDKLDLYELIDEIISKEGLILGDGVKSRLVEISGGDVRQTLNLLQSCASLSNEVNLDVIKEVSGIVESFDIKEVLEMAVGGGFLNAKKRMLDIMLENGLSGIDIIKQIQKTIYELNISDDEKLKLIEKCGEVEFRLVEGADDFIQIEALLAGFGLVDRYHP